ncbi:MAG: hypothetical protein MUP26_09655, partial [Desulfobulbaceae bacterium]|nr:hypothetical protein [Desulfobulbaceae bacterium]
MTGTKVMAFEIVQGFQKCGGMYYKILHLILPLQRADHASAIHSKTVPNTKETLTILFPFSKPKSSNVNGF